MHNVMDPVVISTNQHSEFEDKVERISLMSDRTTVEYSGTSY